MRPKIPPKPIQPSLGSRSPRPRNLENASSYFETSVGGYNLETGDPFGKLAALLGRYLRSVGGVFGVDFVRFGDYFFG